MTITLAQPLVPAFPAAVRALAQQAIDHRLRGTGQDTSRTIYHVNGTPGVVIHVNSGGNACAVESALLRAGYVLGEVASPCCDMHGVALLVTGRDADRQRADEDAAAAEWAARQERDQLLRIVTVYAGRMEERADEGDLNSALLAAAAFLNEAGWHVDIPCECERDLADQQSCSTCGEDPNAW